MGIYIFRWLVYTSCRSLICNTRLWYMNDSLFWLFTWISWTNDGNVTSFSSQSSGDCTGLLNSEFIPWPLICSTIHEYPLEIISSTKKTKQTRLFKMLRATCLITSMIFYALLGNFYDYSGIAWRFWKLVMQLLTTSMTVQALVDNWKP